MENKHAPHSEIGSLGNWLLTNRKAGIAEIIWVFGGAFVVMALVEMLLGGTPAAQQASVTAAIITMLLLLWAGLKLRGQRLTHFGLKFGAISVRSVTKAVLHSIPTFLAATLAFVAVASLIGLMVTSPDKADYSAFAYLKDRPWALAGSIVTLWFTASFAEEVIYRGFLITRIAEVAGDHRHSMKLAVLLSSILFGLAHYAWGPAGILQTFAMGLVLAIAYLKSGKNLWVTILAHAYMDTALLVSIYFSL